MANTNSTIITGVGDPENMVNVGIAGARMRFAYDTFRLASNPADGDTYALSVALWLPNHVNQVVQR